MLSGCRTSKSSEKIEKNNDRIVLDIAECTWVTQLTQSPRAMVGYVNLVVHGKTNAERLTVRTYGDGLWGDQEVKIKPDGMFTDTIGISFTYFSSPPDFTVPITSRTVIKTYMESTAMDTTVTSGPLYYRR